MNLAQVVKPTEIDIARLRLRQWRAADREPFAVLNADPTVMEFFPALLSRAESDAMASRCEGLIAERGWGLWAAVTKNGREFLGFVGLHRTAPEMPFSFGIEISWRLAARHWGNGYATGEACAGLRVGFTQLHFPEIVAFTAVGNSRSRAVMERIGMRHTGEFFEHPKVPVSSLLRTHCLYHITHEQWEANDA